MAIIPRPVGPPTTTCALCLERPLRDSHVIPEFLYKSIYDEKHRFYALAVGEYPGYEQKGIRESLLCELTTNKTVCLLQILSPRPLKQGISALSSRQALKLVPAVSPL